MYSIMNRYFTLSVIFIAILFASLGTPTLLRATDQTPAVADNKAHDTAKENPPNQANQTQASGHTAESPEQRTHNTNGERNGDHEKKANGHQQETPSLIATLPFVIILLCIALLPLIHSTEHWWHQNKNKFIVSGVLATFTLIYYLFRETGFHHAAPGWATLGLVLQHAVLDEYIPFIVLLFSLYTISGGIQLRGDVQATPRTNVIFLAAGAGMASFIGTTGASMLLIRPLLQTNAERKNIRHTVIFFIFLVSNIGGSLLPIGDPPLFLGYLRGVPFLWTLTLLSPWAASCLLLLAVYYVWDSLLYRREPPVERFLDESHIEPLRVRGLLNFIWLFGVVLSVALLVPGKEFLGRFFVVPDYLREGAMLTFVGIAWVTSSPRIRKENRFNFFAIIEVAALFIGVFITMQVPVEILHVKGPELGLTEPYQYFWATGILSSFLDNAPTYIVFFETASSLPAGEVTTVAGVAEPLLIAVSLGAVFMGANSYLGNGPNFMVKSIAEQSGVKMPSFFGYMIYSVLILFPVFILVTFIFLP